MKKLNNQGFTLVELLAVIVVLALLMVVATSSIGGALNNAKKNTLKTEAQKMLTAAYTDAKSSYMLTSNFNNIVNGNAVDDDTSATKSSDDNTYVGTDTAEAEANVLWQIKNTDDGVVRYIDGSYIGYFNLVKDGTNYKLANYCVVDTKNGLSVSDTLASPIVFNSSDTAKSPEIENDASFEKSCQLKNASGSIELKALAS